MAMTTTSTPKTSMHTSEGRAGQKRRKALTPDDMGGLSDLDGRPCVFIFSFSFSFRIRVCWHKSAVSLDARLIFSIFLRDALLPTSDEVCTTILEISYRCNPADP